VLVVDVISLVKSEREIVKRSTETTGREVNLTDVIDLSSGKTVSERICWPVKRRVGKTQNRTFAIELRYTD